MKQTSPNTTPQPALPLMDKYSTIAVKRWMLTQHHLHGMSLLVYALIYQTRSKEKPEGWTAAELGKWFGSNASNMHRTLETLVSDGLLNHDDAYFIYVQPKRIRRAAPQTEEQRQEVFRRGLVMDGIIPPLPGEEHLVLHPKTSTSQPR